MQTDGMRWRGFSDAELAVFRRHQRRSFAIQEAVAARLVTGVTEREVAKALWLAYREEGVRSYFHLPVVLFGDRTALPDPWGVGSFYPTDRALAPGDAVILDASPIVDGYLVDTSTSWCHEPIGTAHSLAAADDLAYRDVIAEAVRAGATFREIAIDVDRRFTAAGYRNAHRQHPGEVLGHRVGHIGSAATPDAEGFAHRLVAWFYEQIAAAEPPSPTWNHRAGSDHPPADGLWAVEPHLARVVWA